MQPIDTPAPPKSLLPGPRGSTAENLEVVRAVIEPDAVQAAPERGKPIGQELNRQVDFRPAKLFWRETVRPKFAHATIVRTRRWWLLRWGVWRTAAWSRRVCWRTC